MNYQNVTVRLKYPGFLKGHMNILLVSYNLSINFIFSVYKIYQSSRMMVKRSKNAIILAKCHGVCIAMYANSFQFEPVAKSVWEKILPSCEI